MGLDILLYRPDPNGKVRFLVPREAPENWSQEALGYLYAIPHWRTVTNQYIDWPETFARRNLIWAAWKDHWVMTAARDPADPKSPIEYEFRKGRKHLVLTDPGDLVLVPHKDRKVRVSELGHYRRGYDASEDIEGLPFVKGFVAKHGEVIVDRKTLTRLTRFLDRNLAEFENNILNPFTLGDFVYLSW